jgi:hypothetical protein
MMINAKPGQAIVPVRGESCEECVFHNGPWRNIHGCGRDSSDFTEQFGGWVFKVVAANGKGGSA